MSKDNDTEPNREKLKEERLIALDDDDPVMVADDDETIDWEPLAASEELSAAAAMAEEREEQKNQIFELFQWRGFDRYRCAKCAFDAVSEKEVYDHFMNNHMPQAPRASETGILDARGDKIYRVEEAHNGTDKTHAG